MRREGAFTDRLIRPKDKLCTSARNKGNQYTYFFLILVRNIYYGRCHGGVGALSARKMVPFLTL